MSTSLIVFICMCLWLIAVPFAAGFLVTFYESVEDLDVLPIMLMAIFWPFSLIIMLIMMLLLGLGKAVGKIYDFGNYIGYKLK